MANSLCLYTARSGRVARYSIVGRFSRLTNYGRAFYVRLQPADWTGNSFVVRAEDVRPLDNNPAPQKAPVAPPAPRPYQAPTQEASTRLTAFASDLGWAPGQTPAEFPLDVQGTGTPLTFSHDETLTDGEGDVLSYRYVCGTYTLTVYND